MHYDSNCFYQTQSFWGHKHYYICLITGKAGKNKCILNWQIAMKTEGCDRLAARDFKPSYSPFLQSCPSFFFFNRGGGDGRKFEWKGQLEWVWNDSCLLNHRFFLLLRGLENLAQSCTKWVCKSNITHLWMSRKVITNIHNLVLWRQTQRLTLSVTTFFAVLCCNLHCWSRNSIQRLLGNITYKTFSTFYDTLK